MVNTVLASVSPFSSKMARHRNNKRTLGEVVPRNYLCVVTVKYTMLQKTNAEPS